MEFEDAGGVVEILLLALAALGLDVAELFEGFSGTGGRGAGRGGRGGEGAMSVDDVEIDAGLLGGWIGGAGEQLGFEERDAVEAPGGVGEFVDELSFGGGGGAVLVEELLDVALEGGGVFGGQDGGVGGEAVALGR